VPSTAGLTSIALDESLESLLSEHPTTTRTVYLLTLAVVGCGIGVLLTASVDVTVRAPAVLRPVIERQTLRAMVDGVVERVAVARDRPVRAGDTILVLGAAASGRAHDATIRALREQASAAHDLRLLLRVPTPDSLPLRRLELARLRASADEARIEQRQLALDVERTTSARDRLRLLAARGFAARVELDAAELGARHAAEARLLARERRRAEWATELAEAEQRSAELRRDLALTRSDRAAHAVTAPVTGTLDELAPLAPGSTVRAGDPVATISPDDALVADVLVSSRDVARLRIGMPVRLLVDGYDVQLWGSAAATVVSVATDYTMSGDQPVFRVRVRPLADSLRRPDGRAVPLKKGLRAQARFLTGRRRLTELLLHRVGEWIDPAAPDHARE
jgi:multidrug resistance efflux pump